MNRLLAAVILAAVLAEPATAAPFPPPLLKAIRAPAASAYRGEIIVTTWDSAGARTTLVIVEHDAPDWSLFEYRPVGSTRRWTVVRRGVLEIQFDPATRTGTRRPRLPDDDALVGGHLPWLQANYRITTRGGVLLGRPVSFVELTPRIPDRPARRMAVDDETGVVLRSERIAPDGRLGEFTAFMTFEPRAGGWRRHAGLADLRLREQPGPRTINEEEAARRFGAPPIAFVAPEGFHRAANYLTEERGPVLHTLYTDGLSVLIVSQHRGELARPPKGSRMVTVGSGQTWVQAMGLRTLVHWAHDGWVLTATGDVNAESLLRSVRATGSAPAPRLIDRLVAWVKNLGLPF